MNQAIITTKPAIVVIGGLVLNNEPLAMIKQLSPDFRFIDINSFSSPFSLDTITRQIDKMLRIYCKPVILIGYSTGGLIALNLTINAPDLVDKLILINSTPCFPDKDNWNGINLTDFRRLLDKLAKLSLRQFKNHFCCLATYPKVYQSEEQSLWQSNDCTKENLLQWLEIIAATDLRGNLVRIPTPILYLYAEYDILVPKSNILVNRIVNQFTLSNSSHAELNASELIIY
ncbi:MAG TPA: alpha/beta fold hydrolase, partial [Aquella sp.]|nr:alpha/beta fold hydrolase [Aquella sp.]